MKKTVAVRFAGLALATLSIAPIAAHSADHKVRACAEAFVAEQFADKRVTIRTSGHATPVPLVVRAQQPVRLSAVDAASGREIATTTCTSKRGVVTVAPIAQAQ
jgi:hypothetical protein